MATTDKHLHNISLPELDTNFGKNLKEQFKYIDANFQKLAALKMYRGEDGSSPNCLIYNLNAIFFYTLYGETGASVFLDRCSFNSDNDAVYTKLYNEVNDDFKNWSAITKQSTAEYAYQCWKILLGFQNKLSCRLGSLPTADNGFAITETDINNENPANVNNFKDSLLGSIWAAYEDDAEKLTPIASHSNTSGYTYPTWIINWAAAIQTDTARKIFNDNITNYSPGRVTIIANLTDDPTDKTTTGKKVVNMIGSLPYVFIDPRFRASDTGDYTNYSQDEQNVISIAQDISCTIYGSVSGSSLIFKPVNNFPQLYFDDGGIYWMYEGKKTNIPAQGSQGPAGKNSQFVIVRRLENCHYIDIGTYDNKGNFNSISNNDSITDNPAVQPQPVGIVTKQYTKDGKIIMNIASPIFKSTDIGEDGINKGWAHDSTTQFMNQGKNQYRIWSELGKLVFWNKGNKYTVSGDGITDTSELGNGYTINNGIIQKDGIPVYDIEPRFDASEEQSYEKIMAYEDVPCIVIPDDLYYKGRYNSTFWFSTIKIANIDGMLVPTVYCSEENMFTWNIDEHSELGAMMGLDVYEAKDDILGNRNKPRGLMLPIGSRMADAENTDPTQEFAAHIIYSDLGPWDNGKPKDTTGNITGTTDGQSTMNSTENKAIYNKKALHIGSINDYTTLNTAAIDNPATPGRTDESATPNILGENKIISNALQDPDVTLYVDEPTVITNNRDRYFFNTLFNIEGSVDIGSSTHVNFKDNNIYKVGGLFVHNILGAENIEGKDYPLPGTIQYENKIRNTEGRANMIVNPLGPFIYPYPILSTGDTAWSWQGDKNITGNYTDNNGLKESYKDLQFKCTSEKDSFENAQLSFRGKTKDSPTNSAMGYWSILVDYGIGSEFATTENGFAVGKGFMRGYNFNPIWSVDRFGNMQTQGTEVRSNADTTWIFKHWDNNEFFGVTKVDQNTMLLGYMKYDGNYGQNNNTAKKLIIPAASIDTTGAIIAEQPTPDVIDSNQHKLKYSLVAKNGLYVGGNVKNNSQNTGIADVLSAAKLQLSELSDAFKQTLSTLKNLNLAQYVMGDSFINGDLVVTGNIYKPEEKDYGTPEEPKLLMNGLLCNAGYVYNGTATVPSELFLILLYGGINDKFVKTNMITDGKLPIPVDEGVNITGYLKQTSNAIGTFRVYDLQFDQNIQDDNYIPYITCIQKTRVAPLGNTNIDEDMYFKLPEEKLTDIKPNIIKIYQSDLHKTANFISVYGYLKFIGDKTYNMVIDLSAYQNYLQKNNYRIAIMGNQDSSNGNYVASGVDNTILDPNKGSRQLFSWFNDKSKLATDKTKYSINALNFIAQGGKDNISQRLIQGQRIWFAAIDENNKFAEYIGDEVGYELKLGEEIILEPQTIDVFITYNVIGYVSAIDREKSNTQSYTVNEITGYPPETELRIYKTKNINGDLIASIPISETWEKDQYHNFASDTQHETELGGHKTITLDIGQTYYFYLYNNDRINIGRWPAGFMYETLGGQGNIDKMDITPINGEFDQWGEYTTEKNKTYIRAQLMEWGYRTSVDGNMIPGNMVNVKLTGQSSTEAVNGKPTYAAQYYVLNQSWKIYDNPSHIGTPVTLLYESHETGASSDNPITTQLKWGYTYYVDYNWSWDADPAAGQDVTGPSTIASGNNSYSFTVDSTYIEI